MSSSSRLSSRPLWEKVFPGKKSVPGKMLNFPGRGQNFPGRGAKRGALVDQGPGPYHGHAAPSGMYVVGEDPQRGHLCTHVDGERK